MPTPKKSNSSKEIAPKSSPVKKVVQKKALASKKEVLEKKIEKKVEEYTEKEPVVSSECCSSSGFSVKWFVITIVFSSIFAAAIVFAGLKMYPQFLVVSNIDEQVDKGIERFIAKQQDQQQVDAQKEQEAIEKAVQGVRPIDEKEDHVQGNPDAQISIIEYSDYECPYCKMHHPVVNQLLKKYGNKVNFVYRHLPLPFHLPNSQDQAEASECVAALGGNEGFWKFTDLLFERTPSNKGFPFEKLQPLAEEVGVNGDKFASCMASDIYLPKVKQNEEEANKLGIRGTPANLIRDNKTATVKYLGGAYPFEDFVKAIDPMLK